MEGASPPPWTPLLGLGFEIPSGRAGRGGWCHGPDWLKAPSPRCWCSRTNHGWGALPGWSTVPPRPPAFAQAALQSSLSWQGGSSFPGVRSHPGNLAGWGRLAKLHKRLPHAGRPGAAGTPGFLLPRGAGAGAAVILWHPGLAGGQGDTSGTPSRTPPGPPSLALELLGCWAL